MVLATKADFCRSTSVFIEKPQRNFRLKEKFIPEKV
jgi:hypothetical protein